MPRAALTAIHHCLPARRLTEAELEARFGAKNVQSIAKLSGIRERRIVEPGMTAADLAYSAADRLLTTRNIPRESIDLLIVTTQTGDYQIPGTSYVLHERLRLSKNCAAYDLNQGCAAYPYALALAQGLFATGIAHRALVLNTDALSGVIHPQDRTLVTLHGDGAVASLLDTATGDEGLLGFHFGTDSSGWRYLCMPASGARQPRNESTRQEIADETGVVRTAEHFQMNGQAIFHFAIHQVPEVVRAAMEKFHVTIADLDLVILHQANRFMIEQIYKKLGVPPEKQFFYLENVGNLSGAATPATLSEAVRQGKVKPGALVLLAAFGVGLSWGVALLRVGSDGLPLIAASTDLSLTDLPNSP
ncbi:MAG TPA: ketoacyl-ACP synthase III [Opitutales bacterium]|jgi:3-oxoacyl-[acyl-carrier-protein] synthase-3|nr:ketoacyl-ACP synthase III [Opitutales bacterium]